MTQCRHDTNLKALARLGTSSILWGRNKSCLFLEVLFHVLFCAVGGEHLHRDLRAFPQGLINLTVATDAQLLAHLEFIEPNLPVAFVDLSSPYQHDSNAEEDNDKEADRCGNENP